MAGVVQDAGVPARPSISTRQRRHEPKASMLSVAQSFGILVPTSMAARMIDVPSGTVTSTPSMVSVESRWPGVRAFSLPSVGEAGGMPHIELGVKGDPEAAAEALEFLRAEVLRLGGKLAPPAAA